MYKTLETLRASELHGNETSVKHGAFVFCIRRLKGDSFNVTKHNPGSDTILASEHRVTFAQAVTYMRAACGETPTTLRKNGRFVTVSHELGRTFYFRVGVEGKPEAATNTMRTDFSSWDEALAHAESLIGE